MVSPISLGSLTGAATSGNRVQLGKDEFLSLLVTQLRNQDPLSPLQPYEFAAQLAQFTSVEQLTQLNQGLAQQTATSQLLALLNKTSFSAALLGRQISAEGDQMVVPSSGQAKIRIEVGGSGGSATLKLTDDSGQVVATRDLGVLAAGRQTVELPNDLPAGTYHYSVTIAGPQGTTVPVTTYTSGVVDAVYFNDGQIMLRIGGMEIPMEALVEIEPVAGSA